VPSRRRGSPWDASQGIDVRLHWTAIPAAAFVALALATGVFPAAVRGLSGGAYAAMGGATALLFFVSLVLHELGHALETRREGIPTRSITRWMLGGVAESAAPLPTPGAEARAALAGPAVSAALGAALVVIGQLTGLAGAIAAVLEWLGWTNLLLLAFNVLPALPLDGGRVLRAALWRIQRDRLAATRAAARVSRALAVGLIGIGAAGALLGAAADGLWLAFMGLFVFSAAAAERSAAEAHAALCDVHVHDVMTPNPITIAASASVQDLLELARRTGHAAYPAVDERGELIGLAAILAAQRVTDR
jgi:Zn-dependent protease